MNKEEKFAFCTFPSQKIPERLNTSSREMEEVEKEMNETNGRA